MIVWGMWLLVAVPFAATVPAKQNGLSADLESDADPHIDLLGHQMKAKAIAISQSEKLLNVSSMSWEERGQHMFASMLTGLMSNSIVGTNTRMNAEDCEEFYYPGGETNLDFYWLQEGRKDSFKSIKETTDKVCSCL